MAQTVDSLGMPPDDTEFHDPASDPDAPDPLIGEQPRSGALAAVAGSSSAPTQTDARRNAANRSNENEQEMQSLKTQYARASQQQSDAYSQEKASIDAATQRLLGLNTGPSDQEAQLRAAAALMSYNGGRGVNTGAVYQSQADVLKERREAELAKQQLLANYGMAGPQAVIGQTNAKINQLTQQERIAQSGLNSAGGQEFRGQANAPYGLKENPDGSVSVAKGMENYWNEKAMSGLYGKGYLQPNPDGTKSWVPLASQAASLQKQNQPKPAPQAPGGAPQAPQVPGSAPQAPRPAPPAAPGGSPAPQVPQAPGAAPAAPQAPTQAPAAPTPYDNLFIPSTVLDPKYGALTPATKPAYVATAMQAFDPKEFSQYVWKPQVVGDNKTYQDQVKATSKELAQGAQGAQTTIYNYGQALHEMDAQQDLLTGPVGQKFGAVENTLRGVLGDDLTGKLFKDTDLAKLATQQETDKYFLQAASTGLKSIYGSKITNMEVQQRLKSLPSNNLLPAVTKMLAAAQAEVAQDQINKARVWTQYKAKMGDPDPSTYDAFYDANFSPFGASKLKNNLTALEAATIAKNTAPGLPVNNQNPIVRYYTALAAAKKNGKPEPKKSDFGLPP